MTAVSDKVKRAQDILAAPLTLDSIREFNALADSAKGADARKIDDLFEALFVAVSADEALFDAAIAEGLL